MRVPIVVQTGLFLAASFWLGSTAHAEDDAESAPPESVEAAENADDEEQEETEAEVEEEEEAELDPELFDDALADFYARRYSQAAGGFYAYIDFGDASAENYEWAQYFLAECLRGLGLWHAATQYYYIVAKTRQQPEILPDALRRLEDISRTRPFSEPLIYEDLMYDSEFGTLPQALSDWVEYTQGLYDFRNDFIRWGKAHFALVSPKSLYGLKARYVEAVYALKKKDDDRALVLFQLVADSDVVAPGIKNQANLALARLLFDLERYKDALTMYNEVEQVELSYEQAQLLLEKAWAHYYLGDRRKAMGLLHALDAPSYQRYFLPDAFILRGLIFKDLCHFIPAKRVVRAFRFTYQRSLDDLRRRVPMAKIQRVFDGATQEGPIARRTALLRALEKERRLIEDYDSQWEDAGFDVHLRRLYDLEIREQARLWRIDFDASADVTSQDLLDAEEQVNLLDYEVGLDIFKRLKASSARNTREELLVVPYDSANVYYEFDTEYWNDELHSYEYFISSRCFDGGEG